MKHKKIVWSAVLGAVLGVALAAHGEDVTLSAGDSRAFGAYTIKAVATATFSIVSGEYLHVTSGNIALSCADDDFVALGDVTVAKGATLGACGRFASMRLASGSTLKLSDLAKGLMVTQSPFSLEGVNLRLATTPSAKYEATRIIVAPNGSEGTPESVSVEGGSLVNCKAEWHEALDGSVALWMVYVTYTGKTAIWKGDKDGVGVLVNESNWDKYKPSAENAAWMGKGQAHLSAEENFAFARRFDIGAATNTTGEVDISSGTFVGNAAEGGAVLLGAEGGTGVVGVYGGFVQLYDYLWHSAITVSSDAYSSGSFTVGAGMVEGANVKVMGGVSVGEGGRATMSIGRSTDMYGSVDVAGPVAVGYAGALEVAGGRLLGHDSFYIGRAANGKTYDATMTIASGTVSNLSAGAGAFLVGSYGAAGSKATLQLAGGELYAQDRFVCGDRRSAQVTISGGRLIAPDVCIGRDLASAEDVAAFQLVSGTVETAGFSCGTNGTRNLLLSGGDVIATAANDDFFKGLDGVQLSGTVAFSNAQDVVANAAVMGVGGFDKCGAGTLKMAGTSVWAGDTVVRAGTLDMDECIVAGRIVTSNGAQVTNAKYDNLEVLSSKFSETTWSSGTTTTKDYARVNCTVSKAAVGDVVWAKDADGVVKGKLSFVSDGAGGLILKGWTAAGWVTLTQADGTAFKVGSRYYFKMLFDFSGAKRYVVYYAGVGTSSSTYARLRHENALTIFPVAGDLGSAKTFGGVSCSGKMVSVNTTYIFYWVGGAVGDWTTGSNWSHTRGGAGLSASQYPKSTSHVAIFDRDTTVTLGSNCSIESLTVQSDVCLKGGKKLTVKKAIEGVGKLTLAGLTLAPNAANVPINVQLDIAQGTVNTLQHAAKVNFVLNRALLGSGELNVCASTVSAANCGLQLSGDSAGFSGVIKIYPFKSGSTYQYNDQVSICDGEASSANAHWEINVENDYAVAGPSLSPGVVFFGTANETYRFGSLKAQFYYKSATQAYWAKDGITLEVGHLNLDSFAGGRCAGSDGVIDWVAPTAAFTNSVTGLSQLRVRGGGRIVMGASDAKPTQSISFVDKGGELALPTGTDFDVSDVLKDSTAPVVFNDDGANHTWATALASSNKGGFVKRGSGTLTWLKAPESKMNITVEEGMLVIPFGTQLGCVTILPGAVLAVDLSKALPNQIIFSADSASQPLTQPSFVLQNVPAGYTYRLVEGENNGVVLVNGSCAYVWTGNVITNANWTKVGNWLVDGEVPARAPQGWDTVEYLDACCATTCLDAVSAALSLDGISDLILRGSFGLSTVLRFALDGSLRLEPNAMSSDKDSPDYYGATSNRLGLSAGARMSIRALSGEGDVSVDGSGVSVEPAEGVADRFVGSLTANSFTKAGSGSFEFIGDGTIDGAIAIKAGTLRLGTYRDIPGLRMDFDASDADSLTTSGKSVTKWKSHDGVYAFTYAAGQHALVSTDYFGGRSTLVFRPDVGENANNYTRYMLSPDNTEMKVSSSTLLFVYQPIGMSGKACFYGDSSDDKRSLRILGTDAEYYWHWYIQSAAKGIFTGDEYENEIVANDVPRLTLCSDTPLSIGTTGNSVSECLGTHASNGLGFKGALAEVVAFTGTLTHVEREVATRQLMRKWDLGYADYGFVKSHNPITMEADAMLDMGGQTILAASFTGAGIVTNGSLTTVDGVITQSGGKLTVPAVSGMTYVGSRAGEKLIITGADGIDVKIVLRKDWFAAGSSGRRVIFCESKNIDWQIERRDSMRPVDEGDGWWSIPSGGFTLRVR